jgi:hypothetical protein
MPSIEELLNEAESHMAAQPVNDVLEINPETREISIPDSEIILGVETDQKAERKYFHCPKIVGNNIDLSALELYVVFQNASNKEEGKDRYHVTDVKTTSDGYITFSWELSAKVTAYKGDVQFVVCAIKTDSSGVKQNVWNTTIAIGKCLIGLSSDMSESEEQSASDLYTQLISELNSTASAKLEEVTTQIQTVGNNQVSNVNNAGTTQVNNVQNKGTEVLASIPDTYAELDASVKVLNEQIRGKAPVITESITIQSGSPTTVTDSAEMPLQGLRVYGKSKQVTTTGANLFDANDVSKGYISDDTGSNIVVANSYCSNFIAVSAKTKYYLYSGQDGGRWGAFYDSSKTFISGISPDKYNSVFETPENAAYIRFTVDYNNNNPDFANNVIFAKSTVALPFEPYTGGKPSPSPDYPQEIVSVGQKLSTGKNLINADEYYSKFKQSDGTYKGENTVINKIAIPLAHFVGKKIVISANIDFPSTIDTMQIRAAIGENNYYGDIVYPNTNKRSVLTVTVQTQNDNFWFTYGSGSGQVIISDIQVELGSTATSYEPYTGGKPAPYKTDCGIEITGKNLLNFEEFLKTRNVIYTKEKESESYQITSIGQAYSNPYKFSDEDIEVTISCKIDDITSKNARIEALDSSKKFITSTYLKDSVKCKASYIRLNYTECGICNVQKVQIERGVTATAYEPYHEPKFLSISTPTGLPAIPVVTDGNYTDVNGQQWIADYIDLKRGKYVQRVWQKTFDGSESWNLYGDTGFSLDNVLPEKMSNREMLCNQFRRRGGGNNSNIIIVGAISLNNSIYIENCTLVNNTLVDDMLSKWKVHLAEHPLKVMTYLNTPIETDLTEAQIQAYKSLTTFKPTSIISNDANAQMEVEYACDTKTWVTNKINTLIKEATTS